MIKYFLRFCGELFFILSEYFAVENIQKAKQ